jgi:hypothetical protein
MPNNPALPPEHEWSLDMLDPVTVEHGFDAGVKMTAPYRGLRLAALQGDQDARDAYRAYVREHPAEVRTGERQMEHALAMLWARHRRVTFRARDELATKAGFALAR